MNSRFIGRLIEKLRLVKIRTRLIAAVLFISVIPMLIFANYSLSVYSDSIRNKLAQTYEHSTQIISANLSSVFYEYSNFMTSISLEPTIQNYLSDTSSEKNSYTNFQFSRDMVNYFYDISAPIYPATIQSISILDRNGNPVFDRGPVLIPEDERRKIVETTDNVMPKDSLVSINSNGSWYIAVCRKIYDKKLTNTHIGYILLLIDEESVNSALLSNITVEEGVHLLLTDSLKSIISSTQPGFIGLTSDSVDIPSETPLFKNTVSMSTKEINTGDGTIVVTFNPKYNAYSIARIPASIFQNEAARVKRIVYISLAILLTVVLFFTLIVYLSILSPINRISDVYDGKQTNRSLRVHDPSNDELGILAQTIDKMADENAEMLQQIDLDDRKKRRLELEALKYQINPHFLFNTLNTLKFIASINNVMPLKNGIDSLTDLLEKTLVEQKEFVPLKEEIQCLKDYCTIQQLRFAGRFDIEYDIEHCTEEFPVPRFILQPLVENSILHGAKDNDDFITILVNSETDNNILKLTVSDDGKGFNVSDIMDKEGVHFNGIGLSNVSERLKLHYGNRAALIIDSSPQKGTLCTITLPIESACLEEDSNV